MTYFDTESRADERKRKKIQISGNKTKQKACIFEVCNHDQNIYWK